MREHKYKGISKKHGHWVYGNLIKTAPDSKNKRSYYIVADPVFIPAISLPAEGFIEIIPETLGEYIGKEDKNGIDIYGGDVAKWHSTEDGKDVIGLISYNEEKACFCHRNMPINKVLESGFYQPEKGCCNLEIIGTKHQNPELLEAE